VANIIYSQEWKNFHQRHRVLLERDLEQFLMDEGRYDCYNSLNYILAELTGNADKANLKRAHFEREGLDLSVPDQYRLGMERFKDAVSNQAEALAEILDRRGSLIKVWFGREEEGNLIFGVFNNAPLLPIEEERYREKMTLARQFKNIQEVMDVELDQSEGGGLGLVITVLMLRKIHLDETYLSLSSDPAGTTALLVIPPRAEQGEEILSQAAVEAIEHIPQFPEHVLKILRTLEDPTKSFAHISPIVREDSNLIAGLLKAANSSVYSVSRKIESIDEAVGVLGLPAIQELLVAVVAEKLLIRDFQLASVKKIVDRSIEVSWYCRELVKAAKVTAATPSVFVGAMLHDFGEIIVNALVPGLTEKIAVLCRAKGWNSFRAETLTDGFNHSLVGVALAQKWKFPERIVEIIRFHHVPLEASRPAQEAVCLVYLGDFLWQKARNFVGWRELAPEVLAPFPIKTYQEWMDVLPAILAKKKPF